MAKLTIEVDLDPYRDSYDGSVFLSPVEEDITEALGKFPLQDGWLLTQVPVNHYGRKTGTITISMEDGHE